MARSVALLNSSTVIVIIIIIIGVVVDGGGGSSRIKLLLLLLLLLLSSIHNAIASLLGVGSTVLSSRSAGFVRARSDGRCSASG